MDIDELLELRKSDVVREREYEEACRAVPFGYLSALDVVRIWGTRDDAWSKNAGRRAAELVTDLDLPLAEMGGSGRWSVKHTVGGTA